MRQIGPFSKEGILQGTLTFTVISFTSWTITSCFKLSNIPKVLDNQLAYQISGGQLLIV